MAVSHPQVSGKVEKIGTAIGGEISTFGDGCEAELTEMWHRLSDRELTAVLKIGVLGADALEQRDVLLRVAGFSKAGNLKIGVGLELEGSAGGKEPRAASLQILKIAHSLKIPSVGDLQALLEGESFLGGRGKREQ